MRDFVFEAEDDIDMEGSEAAWFNAGFIDFFHDGVELVTAIPRAYAARDNQGLWYTSEEEVDSGGLLFEAGRISFQSIREVGARSEWYSHPWCKVEYANGKCPINGNYYYACFEDRMERIGVSEVVSDDPIFRRNPPS